MPDTAFAGLELLETATLAVCRDGGIRYVNPACENLLALSQKELLRHTLSSLFVDSRALVAGLRAAVTHDVSFTEHDLSLNTINQISLQVICTLTPINVAGCAALIELRPIEQQLKIANEERLLIQQAANRELIRNLAHEIKNPLGGIRGAAQLLAHELADRPDLKEYLDVITHEAVRLQQLLDRLLAPNRKHILGEVNIHEVLERVRSVALAEYPQGIAIRRDYDTSLPALTADKEQLIQVVLNIVRNAIQAMHGRGQIVLRTRVARQVTLARKRYQLAMLLQIIDNGPGIPAELKDHIFYPLVTGRAEGTGLGLTIAQTYVHQHGGTVEFDSRPGHTCFTVLLPFGDKKA
ncbi:nitrogen regulation protein NR(II) [Rivihabitans pingtungensis]|jgi:two-component system nitrogen regulation sensor histidine kinase GlnL|uniref:Sensory histidine kinase/phosphatase NtrB n=1 Tax=Rivihabitans pingtungensis TaxID=1054498 RepID=A0A318L7B9_9NEIS|nr:nitrogen regulation protein NR(II) [Rivihabitans pingtungensis]PXX81353.1 two-component system nitrogen regulation sensor histidine kinase GlnL [Rivihabitans pingtungensis]HNX71305.1 nitrogen regulation protein NR(II) [Rivihabitans pingtungensis]